MITQLNQYTFQIQLTENKDNSVLLRSIKKRIHKMTYLYEDCIQVTAVKMQSLKDILPLSYDMTIKLIWCLFQQEEELVKNNFAFYTLDADDIIVINDNEFLCVHSKNIIPIRGTNFCLFTPFDKRLFCSPELEACSQLPDRSIAAKPSFYYSLALFAFFCLFGTREINSLHYNAIIYTPLYWYFLKSLREDPKDRKCILVQ